MIGINKVVKNKITAFKLSGKKALSGKKSIEKAIAPYIYISNCTVSIPPADTRSPPCPQDVTYLSVCYFWRQRLTERWIHFKSDIQNTDRNL